MFTLYTDDINMSVIFQQENPFLAQRTSQCARGRVKSYPSHTIIHPKLEMTKPGDSDEQEADVAARDVMGGRVFRKFSGGGADGGMAVSSRMESQLNQLQGGGQALPDGLRGMMERGFDRDFSQVRLHTDGEAAGLSGSIHAKAFTHGNDIYFNQGQYAPETSEGQRLVAHELAHVAQGGKKVGRENEEQPAPYIWNSDYWASQFELKIDPSVLSLNPDILGDLNGNIHMNFLYNKIKKISDFIRVGSIKLGGFDESDEEKYKIPSSLWKFDQISELKSRELFLSYIQLKTYENKDVIVYVGGGPIHEGFSPEGGWLTLTLIFPGND